MEVWALLIGMIGANQFVFLASERRATIGSSQTCLFQTWLFAIFTRKRSFVPFCVLLRTLRTCVCALLRPFALFCAHLRVSASDRVYNDRVWELQKTKVIHSSWAFGPKGQDLLEKSQPNTVRNEMIKNLLMPLFLLGCFPMDSQEAKRPLRTKSVKHPIKVGQRPINEGKRPIKAVVLVGISVGCLMGCFRAPPPWRKTAPLLLDKKGPLRGL